MIEELKNRVLNGGRGSGKSLRLLIEVYENQIAELEEKLANADYQLEGRDNEIKELQEENKQLKLKIDALSNEVPWKDIFEKNEQIKGLEKQIEELKAQIEKMKCCGNCKHHRYTYGELECVTKGCENKSKWELAE